MNNNNVITNTRNENTQEKWSDNSDDTADSWVPKSLGIKARASGLSKEQMKLSATVKLSEQI